MNNVIRPLTKEDLKILFDEHSLKVMEFFLKELMMTKPEVLPGQNDIPIYAAQEYVEQWFVQALGATPIGAGSSAFDILKENEYVADIKSLTYKVNQTSGEMNSALSGEASLGQKFDTDNENGVLDDLFFQNRRADILDLWKTILREKYTLTPSDNPDNLSLYFFFILRGPADFYLTGASIDIENIDSLSVNIERSTNQSIFVDGYIDSRYGTCKIYKAKKRMELRLYSKRWVDEEKCLKFDIPQDRIEKNLRTLSIDGQLGDYLNEKFQIIEQEDNII